MTETYTVKELAEIISNKMKVEINYIKNPRKEVQYRQMKSHVRHFSGQIWIYSDRIAFTKFVGDIEVVIIENKVFAETLRAVMQIAWEASDPVRISATE